MMRVKINNFNNNPLTQLLPMREVSDFFCKFYTFIKQFPRPALDMLYICTTWEAQQCYNQSLKNTQGFP